MHHLLELALWLIAAFIVGWLIGRFVHCVLLRGGRPRSAHAGDGRGMLTRELPGAPGGAALAGGAVALAGGAAASAMHNRADATAGTEVAVADAEDSAKTAAGDAVSGVVMDDGGDAGGVGGKRSAETEVAVADAGDSAKTAAGDAVSGVVMDDGGDAGGVGGKRSAEDAGDDVMSANKVHAVSSRVVSDDATADAASAISAANSAESDAHGTTETTVAVAGAESTRPVDMPAYGLSAPIGGKADDLQMISGIGPKLEKMLHEQGIFHFAQIAAWTKKDIEEIDGKLKFKGRIEREEWVRQAKLLAAGNLEQFEREYGTGGKKGADGKTRSGSRTRRESVSKTTEAPSSGSERDQGEASAAGARAGERKAPPVHGLSAPIGGKADDLQMISGIGPKLEKMLHEQGIFHFAQIAAWTKKDIEEIDGKLKFKGRIEREEWVRQAKLLAAGNLEQFEREYGTGGKKGADGKTRSGSRTRKKS